MPMCGRRSNTKNERRQKQQVQQMQVEVRQLQQTITVKQDELTKSNQDGARLVADLSHAREVTYQVQQAARRQETIRYRLLICYLT